MNGKCYVFAAGDYDGGKLKPEKCDFVIAADAGLKHCTAAGIRPDLVIGDFDSGRRPEGLPVETFPVEKDETDTVLAVQKGLHLGFREFHLFGCTGGSRPDHTIANLQTLHFLAKQGARAYLYDRSYIFTVISDDEIEIGRPFPDATLSVFCVGEDADGVSIRGTQYEIADATLSAAFPLGVSNHFKNETAEVSVRRGSLLIGWERRAPDCNVV